MHKDSAWKESWKSFKSNNRVVQSVFNLQRSYSESDHPMVEFTRNITDRVRDAFGGFFEESESVLAIKKFQELEPGFQQERFMRLVREYIVPEVMDAYLSGDTETLRLWCSEAVVL